MIEENTTIDFLSKEKAYVLKEYYARFLMEVKGRKKSTLMHYYNALNSISQRLKSKGLVNDTIYEITDLDYLYYIKDELAKDPSYIEQDQRGHRMYSSGLNRYCEFVSGTSFPKTKESIKKMDIPLKSEKPVKVEQFLWKRSNILKNQALMSVDYCCEIDKEHTSFISESTNRPYMEGHHVIPMKKQAEFRSSLDVYANIICLCPVCHRQIHYGLMHERLAMISRIYDERAERLANSGIKLSKDEFTSVIVS